MNFKYKRFWEIDFLRGIAIILMVLYHLLFDLSYFGKVNININSGIYLIIGRSAAILFLILVGISLTLSYSRNKLKTEGNKENNGENKIYKKFILRGIKIFSLGLIITFFTWLIFPNNLIIFGILHLIGISIILSLVFLRLNEINKEFNLLNLFLGIFLMILGLYLMNFNFNFNWLLWLGVIPYNLSTFDYFPILPWFGFVLMGLFLGNRFYKNYERQFKFINNPNNMLITIFQYLGKHSLPIYFIHQPLIFLFLYIFGIINI